MINKLPKGMIKAYSPSDDKDYYVYKGYYTDLEFKRVFKLENPAKAIKKGRLVKMSRDDQTSTLQDINSIEDFQAIINEATQGQNEVIKLLYRGAEVYYYRGYVAMINFEQIIRLTDPNSQIKANTLIHANGKVEYTEDILNKKEFMVYVDDREPNDIALENKPQSASETLIESVATDDPLVKYHQLEEGTKEYKSAKATYGTANKMNSFENLIDVLRGFKRVGDVFLWVGAFVSIYALRFDFEYYLKGLANLLGEWSWIVAIVVVWALLTIFKKSIKALLSNKVRRVKSLVIMYSLFAVFTMSSLVYMHARFGVKMTEKNSELIKAEKLADKNSVENAKNKTIEDSTKRKNTMYENTQDSLKTAKTDLAKLKKQMDSLDVQYSDADKKYKETNDKKWRADRRKVYQLQKKKKTEIDSQQKIVDKYSEDLKKDSDSITKESEKKTQHLASIDSSLSEDEQASRIFLWVFMAVIEIMGLMTVLSELMAILLVPRDISMHLMRFDENNNNTDMLLSKISRMEAQQITASSRQIDNGIDGLQVTQAIGHAHTVAITEAMAKQQNNNTLLLEDIVERYK